MYSFESFEKELNKITPVKLISFTGVKNYTIYQCKKCNEIYQKRADGLLKRTTLCKKCYPQRLQKARAGKEKAEQYAKEKGWDITVLEFQGAEYPGRYKCNRCGKIYRYSQFQNFYDKNKKSSCQSCNPRIDFLQNKEKMIQDFELQEIDVISIPENYNEIVRCKCRKCSTIFERQYEKARINQNCPYCAKNGYQFSFDKFQKILKEKFSNSFEILEKPQEWQGIRKSKVLVRHRCGFIFSKNAERLLDSGCPKCNKKMTKGEKEILEWLQNHKIIFIYQYFQKINNKNHFFDFYLPEKKIIIEYDGIQHTEPVPYFGGERQLEKVKDRDKQKEEWCKNNDITLIRVPYTELGHISTFLESSTTILRE